jgi:hypothetical protein
MSESSRPRLGPVRSAAFTIFGLAVLALFYPLKVYIHGVPWNELPPLAWKAIPRRILDARTRPPRTVSLVDNEDFRMAYLAWITGEKTGWRSEKTSYPTGLLVIADTVRLNLLPDRHLAVLIYRAPIGDGSEIELVKEVSPEKIAAWEKDAAQAFASPAR